MIGGWNAKTGMVVNGYGASSTVTLFPADMQEDPLFTRYDNAREGIPTCIGP